MLLHDPAERRPAFPLHILSAMLALRRLANVPRERITGAIDARRLAREHPRLVPTADGSDAARRELAGSYDHYTKHVSTGGHAASLEACVFLDHLCRATQARRVLDLGSGFSSYVLQRYRAAAAHDVAVVSVDTDADWLAKTRRYLGEQDIDDAHLVEWSDFESRTWEPFDVIFHDLAGGDLRESAMPVAVRNMAGAGCIVFDDAHHAGHRRRAYEVGRENKLSVYSVFDWTHDNYGRYSLLGVA